MSDIPYSYLSVSRIKSYQECSQKYKNKYVDGIPDAGYSKATLVGSLVHEALEEYYLHKHPHVVKAFNISAIKTLQGRLFSKDADLEELDALLKAYAIDGQSLYERASEEYKGPAPIRTKDGKVPSNALMTSAWKQSLEKLGLVEKAYAINKIVSYLCPSLPNDINIAEVYAEAYFLCGRFKEPSNVIETIHVEFPISDVRREGKLINAVLLPQEHGGSEGKYLNGYIDKVALVNHEGEEGLAIIDFKSGGEFAKADIEYNPQLYSYVYAYELVTGDTIKFIGIHNIRKNNQVLIPVDREVMDRVLTNLFSTHALIKAGIFRKHLPDSKYSKCLNSYGKPCPYLELCWPGVKVEEKKW